MALLHYLAILVSTLKIWRKRHIEFNDISKKTPEFPLTDRKSCLVNPFV